MRKKSHLVLAKWIAEQTEYSNLKKYHNSFYIGSILPDCKPSFLTRKHEFRETYLMVEENIFFLTDKQKVPDQDSTRFWRKLGEVIHYLADFFTFPHNPIFKGGLREHCQYEKRLKYRLKEVTGSGIEVKPQKRHFTNVNSLTKFVKEEHERYLRTRQSMEDDIRYIIRVCVTVVTGILGLLENGNGMAAA